MSKPLLYCDMDGVLCDFLTPFCEWARIKNVPGAWINISYDDWQRLRRERPNFWKELDWLEYGKDLWNIIKSFHPSLLTGTPGGWPEAGQHKKIWAERNIPKFGYHPLQKFHAGPPEDKPKLARQADGTPNILIDDLDRNVQGWEKAGGIGVLYTPSPESLELVISTLDKYEDVNIVWEN